MFLKEPKTVLKPIENKDFNYQLNTIRFLRNEMTSLYNNSENINLMKESIEMNDSYMGMEVIKDNLRDHIKLIENCIMFVNKLSNRYQYTNSKLNESDINLLADAIELHNESLDSHIDSFYKFNSVDSTYLLNTLNGYKGSLNECLGLLSTISYNELNRTGMSNSVVNKIEKSNKVLDDIHNELKSEMMNFSIEIDNNIELRNRSRAFLKDVLHDE